MLASSGATARVLAIVVTYQCPGQLRKCVEALREQSYPVDLLVVDNHSKPAEPVVEAAAGAEVIRLPRNTGPAGGFAAGTALFLDRDYELAWLLDDDVSPAADCLETLVAASNGANVVAAPQIFDELGEPRNTWGWVGLLVPRRIFAEAGLPASELFWGEEDAEWLHYRVRELHGFELLRVPGARATVVMGRPGKSKPAWKYYYEVRNVVYVLLYRRRHMRLSARLKVLVFRLLQQVHTCLSERRGRGRRFVAMLHGALHGFIGRTGRTVLPESADRPGAGPGT